jgi:hypothetical protein
VVGASSANVEIFFPFIDQYSSSLILGSSVLERSFMQLDKASLVAERGLCALCLTNSSWLSCPAMHGTDLLLARNHTPLNRWRVMLAGLHFDSLPFDRMHTQLSLAV